MTAPSRIASPQVQFPTSLRLSKPASRSPKTTGKSGEPGSGTLKFERRAEARRAAEGVVIATYRAGSGGEDGGNGRFGITHLELLDSSDGGIGVLSQTSLPPGTLVTIGPPGSGVPWLNAVSVRCGAHPDGHEVGLYLTRPKAA